MRRALVVVLLAACTGGTGGGTGGNGGSGGGSGGGTAGGGGGSGGGTAVPDAGVTIVIDPTGFAAIAIPGADASVSILALDASVSDGGYTPVVQYGPDGLVFPTTAAGAFIHRVPVLEDGGFDLPFFALQRADGGREDVAVSSVIDVEGRALSMPTLPHFSELVTLEGGLRFTYEITPNKFLFEVGEGFKVRVIARTKFSTLMSGSIGASALGALTYPGEPPYEFTDAPQVDHPYLGSKCAQPGPGTAVITVTLSNYPKSGGASAAQPPQTYVLHKQVLCLPSSRPKNPQTFTAATKETYPTVLPSDGSGPSALGAAAWWVLRDFRKPVVVTNGTFGVQTTVSCGGGGNNPCPIGPTHFGSLTLTNGSVTAVHFDQRPLENLMLVLPTDPVTLPTERTRPLNPPVSLGPSAQQAFPFTFVCTREGRANLVVSLRASFKPRVALSYLERDSEETTQILLGKIQCGGTGDAVMLSDNTRLTRTGNTWNAMATGVTANLIAATDNLAPNFGALNEQTVGLDAVAQFTGRVGAIPRFRFVSGRQTATWNHTGSGYTQTGLVGGAAFNATDSLTVTGLAPDGGTATFPDGGAAIVTLPAPPALPAAAQLFGARDGLRTLVRLPDGTFDVLYVSTTTPSPMGGTGGIFRTVRAADMALDAGFREAPVMDEAAIRALTTWGLDAGVVYIAAYRQTDVEGFFTQTDGGPRPVPVQAGRMVQVNVADLAP